MGQMRKAEQARLVADLLDYLFTHNRDPLTLVLEEADAFAPQPPMGELTRVLGEVDRIARRGRNFGFRLISITQRPAKLNKYVLTQLASGAGVLRIGVADDAASMATAGKYNGRQWRSFSQSQRLPFVVGIHEGLQECMMEAQAIAADKITVAALGQLEKVYFSDSSYAEVVSQINLFYADPANAVIPVTQVYSQAVMKFKGLRPQK
jgi:hypothetical protein